MNSALLFQLGLEVLPYPPYSPESTPSDYHLFGPMAEICIWYWIAINWSSVVFCIRHSETCWQMGYMLNEFDRYVEKWNVNVWPLNRFACWTCSFSRNSQSCVTLCELWRKSGGQNTAVADCSPYKWHHNCDVIFIKIQCIKLNSLQNIYFRFFLYFAN